MDTVKDITLPVMLGLLAPLTGCNLKMKIATLLLAPRDAYDEATIAPSPDYADDAAWAALPGVDDAADMVPEGAAQAGSVQASAFYVHPGTLLDRRVWVGDPQEAGSSRDFIDKVLLAEQASLLNACCDVYAPRYRQVTYGAYLVPLEDAQAAFAVAYNDVDRAFTSFLARIPPEQPFIVAAHSQGALHTQRLLKRIHDDPQLRLRLIAAYVPGNKLPLEMMQAEMPELPVCTAAEQTGCVASWNTYGTDFDPYALDTPLLWKDGEIQMIEPAPIACFNPVSGTGSPEPEATPLDQHLGTLERGPHPWDALMDRTASVSLDTTPLAAADVGLIRARCDADGILRINDVREDYLPAAGEEEEYHLFDVQLFYMNLRADTQARTTAWWRAQAPPTPAEPDQDMH